MLWRRRCFRPTRRSPLHSQRPTLAAGTHIGKYVIERLLGQGANGAVYEAADQVLGRRVALKLLHPQLVFDPQIAGRFRQEAQAMAQLNHPHVVTVHDLVGDSGTWAIVMELIDGGETLASLLRREGRLAPLRAVRLIQQVAAGLGHAHARGVVHRDVKPANVMIVRHGDVEIAKISDFGIARLVHGEKRTQGQLTLGTLWYLAPEQAQSSSVDARADVYALGATLYEALIGRVIFPYDNVARVLAAAISETPVPPSQRAPGIPPAVDELVLRFVAKSPAARPTDGDAARLLLEELASQLEPPRASPGLATPTSLPAPALSPPPGPTFSPHGAPMPAQVALAPAVSPSPAPPTPSPPSFRPPAPAIHTPFDGSSAAPAVLSAASSASTNEGRIGFWVAVGAVAVVSFACLTSSLLCVVTGLLR
ncbi:MAG: hypothetical protein OHK0013_29040 [Sandaracinaceae bacterium]